MERLTPKLRGATDDMWRAHKRPQARPCPERGRVQQRDTKKRQLKKGEAAAASSPQQLLEATDQLVAIAAEVLRHDFRVVLVVGALEVVDSIRLRHAAPVHGPLLGA